MTATAKSGHATNHVRNKYRVYEILVDIGEESTIAEIVREFAIRNGGEVLNRNTARARKSEFKKDMKEVEIVVVFGKKAQDEYFAQKRAERHSMKMKKLFQIVCLCLVSGTIVTILSKLGYL